MIFKYLLLMLVSSVAYCRDVDESDSCAFGTYDYIVVGSGSAGSVVVNRLTSDENITVLLLEAGGYPTFHSEIPFLAAAQHLTEQNWGYHMERQPNFALGLNNELMPWPRGKVLGGSSVINSMLYVRGNKEDYDRWAAGGNPGWSYDEVLPYFKKSEYASLKRMDSEYHGIHGLLNVQDVPYRTKSAKLIVNGFQDMGYRYVDYNGKDQMGVSYVQATQRDGRRCSAEKAFIRPAEFRPNLKICLHRRVSKVLLNENKEAYGVQYIDSNNTEHKVYATREVILSAGTFHSPQILMLSGIGPKDHLSDLNIPLVQNLPVGEKLFDHLAFIGLVFTVEKPIIIDFSQSMAPTSLFNFLVNGRGVLTLPLGVEAFAYYKTSAANYSENYPDIEFMFTSGSLHTDHNLFFKNTFGVTATVYEALWKDLESKYAWSISPILFHPKSHGSVKLRSKDPLDPPLLYGNYLSDPENYDLRALIDAIREVQRVTKGSRFEKLGTEQVRTPVPGCEQIPYDSDPYWECAIRHIPSTMNHQTSTCKMGPKSDTEAVVDHKLRVHGVKNLRVIDTSIIPVTLSGHTNAVAFMIGEKSADLILDDYYISRQ
ncbi:hypothetical protein RI129_012590 [Pyrocoelia pectoralis]|uniref:Glucose-methanol-choline oxidoreductase N-terminal domain-containing protein n=1 Tax=Pyrocoelia pectoralis TaxID=417401 RepID=A0AAN7UTR8_9COLE